jgi:hypothetical protein
VVIALYPSIVNIAVTRSVIDQQVVLAALFRFEPSGLQPDVTEVTKLSVGT